MTEMDPFGEGGGWWVRIIGWWNPPGVRPNPRWTKGIPYRCDNSTKSFKYEINFFVKKHPSRVSTVPLHRGEMSPDSSPPVQTRTFGLRLNLPVDETLSRCSFLTTVVILTRKISSICPRGTFTKVLHRDSRGVPGIRPLFSIPE